MLETTDSKIRLKTFAFFTCIIMAMSVILILFALFAKKNYTNKLKTQVEIVMHDHRPLEFPEKYRVGEAIQINSSIAVSSSMYAVVTNSSSPVRYVLVTRVTTYYGPQAAVFLYDKKQGVTFEGFCCLNQRIKQQFENPNSDLIIKYWKEQALKIFEASVPELGGYDE
ncbi:MAG: hypothetical protein IK002_10825 [Treponema sp.]|uniref:hypothetical protein n=1 Tax=Treponema sp. TaxID=166 RepID=UPI00298E1D55|nr:hypothetical protein [Treponema sp.]MBR5934466.1 hypothetical protein [Treponema sp.]